MKEEQSLSWWQLSLIGVGCTIGTGFFLGSSIAITKSGYSVCISFLLASRSICRFRGSEKGITWDGGRHYFS
ncbi:hypothetical protein QEN29_25260 [Escherichia coli]|nr:hypothetical protein QEN29_25260 [Escherichia coli]